MQVEGSILSNGTGGNGYSAGSGAGGSVNIQTELLHGAGIIAANGGVSEVGGGGGRVAVLYRYTGDQNDNLDDFKNVSAFGGHGSSRWGSAGTVVLRKPNQTYGDLYIDDNMTNAASSAYTPLVHMGFGISADLTADTLTTDGTVTMVTGGFVGLMINPNTSQDQVFSILDNTETTITVDISGGTSLTDVASAGDTYCGVFTFDNIIFRRGGSLVMGDTLVVEDTLQISEYGRLTHYDATLLFTSRLNIITATLDVDASGGIVADGRGYLGGLQDGNDNTGQTDGNTDGATKYAGGSFGGVGGIITTGITNATYGSLTMPVSPGAGGGSGGYSTAGGDGGGRIRIQAHDIYMDGLITANGAGGNGNSSGSGSGGSILITTDLLDGIGTISANGGTREVGGGGGRIAVTYSTLTMDPDLIQVIGGQGSSKVGGNGTLVLKQAGQTYGDLVINGQNLATPDDAAPIPDGYVFDNITLKNQARVTANHPLVVQDTLALENGSTLSHSAGSESGLSISAAHVTVDSTSAIDVSGKGYAGGLRDGNGNCEGITLGGISGATSYAAGAYGGYGAVSGSGVTNSAYGQPDDPAYLGSGGGCGGYSSPGGNGGGRVLIMASGSTVIDGSIMADGQNGSGNASGSGSGGAISIETHLLAGTGSITANGGAREMGGGGGRIAVSFSQLANAGNDLDGLQNILAAGGRGTTAVGSAGTVLINQDGIYGDLYIDDNQSGATASFYTPLPHLGFGTVTALTDDTLTCDGLVTLMPNSLAGMVINPNTGQDQLFTVITNTDTTLVVDISGGVALTDVASVGDTYCGVYRFDNLIFRRGGFLVVGDQLRVTDTMDIDDYGRLTHFDTTLTLAPRLNIMTHTLNITATGAVNVDGRGYLGGLRSGNDETGQTLGNTNGATKYAGGSHGGLGGEVSTGVASAVYGSASLPIDSGAGGGCGSYSRTGGDGGGRVAIEAVDIQVDGAISAGGTNGGGYSAGSGAGGSVLINTQTLSGSGAINADGGEREVGGGGGRVAVYYDTMTLAPANISAAGGIGSSSAGGDGTMHLEKK